MNVVVPVSFKYMQIQHSGLVAPKISVKDPVLKLFRSSGFPPNAVLAIHDGRSTPPFPRATEKVWCSDNAIAFQAGEPLELTDGTKLQVIDNRFTLSSKGGDVVGPMLEFSTEITVQVGWLETKNRSLQFKSELTAVEAERVVELLRVAFRRFGYRPWMSFFNTSIPVSPSSNANAYEQLQVSEDGMTSLLVKAPHAEIEIQRKDDFGRRWMVKTTSWLDEPSPYKLDADRRRRPRKLSNLEVKLTLCGGAG